MLFSGQLDLGNIRIQVGIEGMQAMILPIALVTLGVLIIVMPAHRMFYGVMSLAFSIYALVGVNLGGFFIGTLLGVAGGVMAVSWMPRRTSAMESPEPADDAGENDLADLVARRWQGHALTIVALAVLLGAASTGLAAGPSFAVSSVTTPNPTVPAAAVSSPTPTPVPAPASTASPAPTSTPTPTPAPTATPAATTAPQAPTAAAPPVTPPTTVPPSVIDQGAPVAATTGARLRSTAVTLEGARYIETVAFMLADGSTRAALKITADRVVLDAFSLDSTNPAAGIPVTNATKVILGGPVTMYCTSLSGSLANGTPVSFEPSTPPPLDVDLPSLTSATIGLLTVTSATATLTGAAMSVG